MTDPVLEGAFDSSQGEAIKRAIEARLSDETNPIEDLYASGKRFATPDTDTQVNVPNDYGTVQDAVDSLGLIGRQRWDLNINNGTYSEDVLLSQFLGGQHNGSLPTGFPRGRVRIYGDDATPSNVELSSLTMGGFVGPRSEIHGIEFTGTSPYDDEGASMVLYPAGEYAIYNCAFDANIPADTDGMLVYSAKADIRDTDISNTRHGVIAKGQATVVCHGLSGSSDEEHYRAINGGKLVIYNDQTGATLDDLSVGTGGTIWWPERGIFLGGGGVGDTPTALRSNSQTYRRDDFRDGAATSARTDQSIHSYPSVGTTAGRYRPDWTVQNGAPSVISEALALANGDQVSFTTQLLEGRWEFDFQYLNAPTSSVCEYQIIREDSNNYIFIQVASAGGLNLRKKEAGSVTTLVSGSWGVNTNPYEVAITRKTWPNSTAEWELTIDETSAGTTTDSFIPSVNNQDQFRIVNFSDATILTDRVWLGDY